MGKKKFYIVWAILVICLLMGCQRQEEDAETIKIVWQIEVDMESPYDYESYLNEVLKEKGYPYQVDFVTEATKEKEQIVDLLNIGTDSWKDTYNMNADILEGKVIPLDEYFETEDGQKLKATLPKKLWDAYKAEGSLYSILSVGYAPFRIAYIWDETLAEKYDIHPEEWSAYIWEYEDELLKIKKEAGVMAVDGIITPYLTDAVGMTKVLGLCYPIVIDEDAEEVKAEFLYETEEYQEALKGIQSLYDCGVYQPELEATGSTEAFLEISTIFANKDAYQQWQEERFWDSHEVKVIEEDTLWKLGCTAVETGITTESKQPEEAFQFMCALYTDPDLTNAVMWGEEGVHYEVENNVAIKKGSAGEYMTLNAIGNQLIGYVEKGQDPNRETTYPEMIENAVVSKISGFDFKGEGCKSELEKVYQVYLELSAVTGEIYMAQPELIIQKYKDAGIDKVVEEWNREFQEWRKQQ